MVQWKYKNLTIIAIITFAILSFLDLISTRIALDLGWHEANPIIAPVIQYFPLIKVSGIIIMIGMAVLQEKIKSGSGIIPPITGNIATGITVYSNFAQLGVLKL